VCTAIGAWGIRLVCLLLKLTGLDRFVGASYGTQGLDHRAGHPVLSVLCYRSSWRTEGSRRYLDSLQYRSKH
jgi:hypothetical protein